jgi:hypothetical protein
MATSHNIDPGVYFGCHHQIKNKQFRGCPKLFFWLGSLIFFVSIFLGTWDPRVFFYFLVGESPVQPLLN